MRKVRFRRVLWGETTDLWVQPKDIFRDVIISDKEDKYTWLLTKSGKFIIRSLYLTLKTDQVVWPHRMMWYAKKYSED